MNLTFIFLETISLPKRKLLKAFLLDLIVNEKKKLSSLNIIFCSDEYLLEINKSYLNHNYYTDIITFDLGHPTSNKIYGEIYISVDTVRSNAKRFSNSIKIELHRVIFHGVLHLCGYNDKTEQEQEQMTVKENFYLNNYFPQTIL